MILACKSCGARFTVAEDKIAGRNFKSRCKSCGGWIFVVGFSQADVKTKKNKPLKTTTRARYSSQVANADMHKADPKAPEYWLRIASGESAGQQFPLPAKGEVVLGTSRTADITLADDVVSRRHALIRVQKGAVILEDLGSTNGTFVNGKQITKARITTDDAILVGLTILNLVDATRSVGASREDMSDLDPAELSKSTDGHSRLKDSDEGTRRFTNLALAVIKGKNKGAKYSLPMDKGLIVGSGLRSDIILDDDAASRKHAQIWVEGTRVQINDLGSTNGTYVNGNKVAKAYVSKRDQILVGKTLLQIVELGIGNF